MFMPQRRYSFLFIVLASLLGLSACDSSSTSYFPLDKGRTYDYQIDITTPYNKSQDTLRIKNLGQQIVDGKNLFVRRTSLGTDYFFKQEAQDVNRVAKRTTVELKPRFDEEKRYVLKSPFEPGTKWNYSGQPYLLDRPFPTDYELKRIIHFDMTYEVISVDEEVTTEAGSFKNCLHIQGTAVVDIGRILTIVADEVKFTTDEWYAPGVGLVKLRRFEDVDSKHAYGGTIEMSLVDFSK